MLADSCSSAICIGRCSYRHYEEKTASPFSRLAVRFV